ncbi:MAG: MBL fold metallo-hydrolase [Parcubacteria group bacterium]|nr:MBL fold metallo-hydrolase [Parcubacteria group bacterium]
MTISWYGEACFLLESGGIRILIEPPQKESGINPPRLKSDVLVYSRPKGAPPEASLAKGGRLASSNEAAKPRAERVAFSDPESGAFIIESPGEYEVKGANILGIADPAAAGQANIIYSIEMDEIKIAHLGFANKKFNSEKLAELDDPDIVLAPVGGGDILDAEGAMNVINQLEPSIAIPMLYDIKGLKTKKAPLSMFLKESEAKESPQPKLIIKKKDLVEEETKIIILSPYGGSPAGREQS